MLDQPQLSFPVLFIEQQWSSPATFSDSRIWFFSLRDLKWLKRYGHVDETDVFKIYGCNNVGAAADIDIAHASCSNWWISSTGKGAICKE